MEAPSKRLDAIDIAKGIAVFLMVLGHAELFLNRLAYFPRAVEDGQYLPIQHLYNFIFYLIQSSVDAFYFFAGVGLAIASARAQSLPAFCHKLRKRALFIIFLDLTVISWAYAQGPFHWRPVFGSIGTFGVSFLLLSFMLKIRNSSMFIAALLIFLLREVLMIREPYELDTVFGVLYGVFWSPLQAEDWSTIFTVFSWLPIIMLGFCFGRIILTHPKLLTVKLTLIASLAFFALFVFSRVYLRFGSLGQPLPKNLVQIFQLDKYPASIHFHLLNLSFVFFYLFLALYSNEWMKRWKIHSVLQLLGRQMLFVYVLHLVLLALLKFSKFRDFVPSSNLVTYFGLVTVGGMLVPLTAYYDRLKRQYAGSFGLLKYL